ncbi:hypothetical protein TNCV_1755601 [Trichonephila clavipes]|nr:hypothetical protein TNCV_1755601 [Trichonephila clavipes]
MRAIDDEPRYSEPRSSDEDTWADNPTRLTFALRQRGNLLVTTCSTYSSPSTRESDRSVAPRDAKNSEAGRERMAKKVRRAVTNTRTISNGPFNFEPRSSEEGANFLPKYHTTPTEGL